MTLPTTPRAWAAQMTMVLRAAVPEASRFPVDVRGLAMDYSQQVFPHEPIRRVEGISLDGCDGALLRIPGARGDWGILYNGDVASPGRINFTLAHELGHYLVHRHAFPDGLQCSQNDIAAGDPGIRDIEREADQFAADLLMPFDDFRRQVPPRAVPDMQALSDCASRYGVSLLAVTLRWLACTERRAVLVVSREGFILWSRPSAAALRTGAYIRTANRPPVEVPPSSLVLARVPDAERRAGLLHARGVWLGEPCTELAVASDRYDFGLSLLLLGDAPDRRWRQDDDDDDPVAVPLDRMLR